MTFNPQSAALALLYVSSINDASLHQWLVLGKKLPDHPDQEVCLLLLVLLLSSSLLEKKKKRVDALANRLCKQETGA